MVTVTIGTDGKGSYTDENGTRQVSATSQREIRSLLLGLAAARARAAGVPVHVTAVDASGRNELLVAPDGSLSPAPPSDPAGTVSAPATSPPAHTPGPAAESAGGADVPLPGVPLTTGAAQPAAPGASPASPPAALPLPTREPAPAPEIFFQPAGSSFLASNALGGPQPTGWRAQLNRLGLKVEPTQAERQEWVDERAVAQHWPGPRTIAVLNGKGGAGKTPTAILLAGFFARMGSGSVVAADGNVTRGTLGWRTEQGPHAATVLDLVPETDRLMAPSARNGDVAAFTHHQTVDQFDVLRSNPLLLSTEQKLTPAQLDDVQRVLTRYYRMIVWDTGNDEGDELWLRIVSHADQIVVATSTRADHAEAGRLLLRGLADRDERGATLARSAVVVVSQADKEEAQAGSLVDGFRALAREVVTIPYDRAMREQWLRSDRLAPATRTAWLHAAAAVARGL